MYVKAIGFLCLALFYEVNCLPFLNLLTGQDRGYYNNYGYSNRLARYEIPPNQPTTYENIALDPVTGEEVTTHYVTHTRPGGPITALVQNVLNTIGRLVGDVGGALGNALGGTLAGAGQLGQDIQDFTKPITINQIVRPPLRPVIRPPPRPSPIPPERQLTV